MAMQRLKDAAEKAKKDLSGVTSTQISLPFITAGADGPFHLELTLTRAKFEELTHDLVERTIVPTRQALSDAGFLLQNLIKLSLLVVLLVFQLYKKQLKKQQVKSHIKV